MPPQSGEQVDELSCNSSLGGHDGVEQRRAEYDQRQIRIHTPIVEKRRDGPVQQSGYECSRPMIDAADNRQREKKNGFGCREGSGIQQPQ